MRWLRNLFRPAQDPRRLRETGDSELDAPSALLPRIESSLRELAQAREQLQATATREADCPETLEAIQRRLAVLAKAERSLRTIQAQVLLDQVDEAVDQAQLRAEALKAQASVVLGLDDPGL